MAPKTMVERKAETSANAPCKREQIVNKMGNIA